MPYHTEHQRNGPCVHHHPQKII